VRRPAGRAQPLEMLSWQQSMVGSGLGSSNQCTDVLLLLLIGERDSGAVA